MHRVESGSDDPDIWVNWVTVLAGQMGLIHKLNHLNVTHISHASLENSASGK